MKTEKILAHMTEFLMSKYQVEKVSAMSSAQMWLGKMESQHKLKPAPTAKISTSLNLEEGRIVIMASRMIPDEGTVLMEEFIMDRKVKGAWRVAHTIETADGWKYICERYAKTAKPKISAATIEKKVDKMGTKQQLALLAALQEKLMQTVAK